MEYVKMRKNLAIWITAFTVVSLIAVAAIIVAYVQYDQKKTYMAQVIDDQSNREKLVMESYDRIESNLARISQYENMITGNTTDAESNSSLSPEDKIMNEINMIEQLINENNQIIASLHSQIGEKDTRLAGYEKTVKDLKGRIVEYKEQVDVLVAEKQALQQSLEVTTTARNQLEVAVSGLNTEVARKSDIIDEKNAELVEKERNLHTAYFTVGTYKTLHEQDIVVKEGGFLGINREKNLSNGLDNKKFHEIDTRLVTVIPVDAKRCEIITNQDPSSYTLVYENDKVGSIKINDPAKFWGKTNYLVVVVRENDFDETADSR
jgi:hypothetical protein